MSLYIEYTYVVVCLLGMVKIIGALVSLFDSIVVLASIVSVLLCTRSVYRALRLGRVCTVCTASFASWNVT